MSKRWILRIISVVMLIAVAVFFFVILTPEMTGDPRITQPLFYGWIIVAIVLFIVSFFIKKK